MKNDIPEKRPLLKMFTAVPPSYDFLNRLLTFGFDQVWRSKAVKECLENNPVNILDLCCGTGDLAIKLRKSALPGAHIVALDYSETMLETAKKKASRRNLTSIDFHYADASNIPFPDEYFDTIGISFAFRNLTFHNPDRDKFLSEILRVLKSSGRFVIVETSQPNKRLLRKLYHIYLKWITAPLGGLLSGHHGAYNYLSYSARNYYSNEELKKLLTEKGFSKVHSGTFLGGIAGLHVVIK